MNFLSPGLKYQDTKIRNSNNNEGAISENESLHATCENIAPDITKKKPA